MTEKYFTSYGEYYFEISVNNFIEFWDFNEKFRNTWLDIEKISRLPAGK